MTQSDRVKITDAVSIELVEQPKKQGIEDARTEEYPTKQTAFVESSNDNKERVG